MATTVDEVSGTQVVDGAVLTAPAANTKAVNGAGGARESNPSGRVDASLLEISLNTDLKPLPKAEDLAFGKYVTDHILTIPWSSATGWSAPRITPYAPLSLDPAACVFHYGFECFEGMKAYRDDEGKIRLFRPLDNLRRLEGSAQRVGLPGFGQGWEKEGEGEETAIRRGTSELLKILAKFVDVEERWVFGLRTHSLYLRPVLIGTSASLSVTAPTEALLYIIASPAGSYFSGTKATSSLPSPSPTPSSAHPASSPGIILLALSPETATRAWPGGPGAYKVGGNYAPAVGIERAVKASKLAQDHGVTQVLWCLRGATGLLGYSGPTVPSSAPEDEDWIQEAGTMNLFVILRHRNAEGGEEFEIATPPLTGTILPGITRDCVLQLARSCYEDPRREEVKWTVAERPIGMAELRDKAKSGDLMEVFGTGTAAVVTRVGGIVWREEMVRVGGEGAGRGGESVAEVMKICIEGAQYGREDVVDLAKEWSVRVDGVLG